jgi:predicted SprT family Zn-dependent metalloprotease
MAGQPITLTRRLVIRDLGCIAGRYCKGNTYRRAAMNGREVYVRDQRPERVEINSQLIDHPEEILVTVGHELAHQVVHHLKKAHGITTQRAPWNSHGRIWKQVAQKLGDTGERCQQLPLKPTRSARRFL